MKYSAFILAVLIIAGGLVVGCAASSEARIKAIGELSGQGKLDEAKALATRIPWSNILG